MTKQNRIQLFDEWARNYEQSVEAKENFPFAGYSKVLETILDKSAVQSQMSVLDLGTGTGNLADNFNTVGCDVFGVDFSQNMLEKARIKVPQATFIQADLLVDLPAEVNKQFDRIVSAYVFHEFALTTKVSILQRLSENNLHTNGLIVIGDVSFPSVAIREEARKKWANQWDEDEHYWAADEVIEACAKISLNLQYKQVSSCGGVFVFSKSNH